MNYFDTFIYDVSLLLFTFLSLQSGYLFLFALAGRLASLKHYNHAICTGRFVIYLFCDNEADVTAAVKAATSLCYPAKMKHIVVITNPLQPATRLALHEFQVQVVELLQHNISKTKGLRMAMAQTEGSYDYALLLDARHICTKGFLYRMNDALQSGFGAVQGQRIVRNTNTTFALLDAIREGVETHIFCKSHQLLGLSSTIADSGVGIQFFLLQDMMPFLSDAGNFNKEIELHLLRRHIHFGYAPKACLYEERKKSDNEMQHKYYHWTANKTLSLKAYLSGGVPELCKGNMDFLDKIFQNLLLPRILLLGITPLTVLVSFINLPVLSAGYWIALWIITYAAIFMSMPSRYITNRFLRAVFFLPVFFINMTKVFLKPKKRGNQRLYSYTAW